MDGEIPMAKSDVYPLQLLLRNVVNIFGNIWKFGWLFHVIPHFIQGTHHGFWWFQTLKQDYMVTWDPGMETKSLKPTTRVASFGESNPPKGFMNSSASVASGKHCAMFPWVRVVSGDIIIAISNLYRMIVSIFPRPQVL